MKKLTRIQKKALNLCIKMADNYEVINAKTFGLRWCEGRRVTLDGMSNTARVMLTKLSVFGYLEKIEISYCRKHYIVLNNPDGEEYVPK